MQDFKDRIIEITKQLKVDKEKTLLLLSEADQERFLSSILRWLTNIIFQYIEGRYGEQRSIEQRRPYHSKEHTRKVMEIVGKMLEHATPKERFLAQFAALFHDTVEEFKDSKMGIRIPEETNESDSNELFVVIANYLNRQCSKYSLPLLFSDEDFKRVALMIKTTKIAWNFQEGGPDQPALIECQRLEDCALAFADLGMVGIDPDEFFTNGQLLYREQNINIELRIQQHLIDHKPFSIDEITDFSYRFQCWCKAQIRFVDYSKMRHYERDIQRLTEQDRSIVAKFFSTENFKLSREKYEELSARCKPSNFYELLKDFGYDPELVDQIAQPLPIPF